MRVGEIDVKEKRSRIYRNLKGYEVKTLRKKKDVSDQRFVVPWQMFDEEWEKLERE